MSITPALLIKTSSLPAALSTCAAALATDSTLVTSRLTFRTVGAGLPAFLAACRTADSLASRLERAARTMVEAPALAKLRAVARPMPLLAPLMKTTLPARLCFVGSMAG